MNQDLFLAILAMDSYNRGYDQGIKGLSSDGRLGLATILSDSKIFGESGDTRDDQSAGFYGISYDVSEVTEGTGLNLNIFDPGTKVVAYRGTDSFAGDWTTFMAALSDPSTAQSLMAISYYRTVFGLTDDSDPRTLNSIITGHSLGAGLAGYVAGLYNGSAVLFDPMPYHGAVATAYTWSTQGGIVPIPDFREAVYGNITPWTPSFSGIRGYYIPTQSDDLASNNLATLRNIVPGYWIENDGLIPTLLSDGVDLGMTSFNKVGQRHSISLQIIQMYADIEGKTGASWDAVAPYLLSALFNQEIGHAIVSDVNRGEEDDAGIFRGAIAYSAITEGTRPFGDTGILSLFDDANDLGRAINLAGANSTISRAAGAISEIVAEFAGKLALGQVMKDANSDVTSGVLTLAPDSKTLSVDLSEGASGRWGAGSAHSEILGRSTLLSVALSSLGFAEVAPGDPANGVAPTYVIQSDLLAGLRYLYSTVPSYSASDPASVIDRIIFKIGNEPGSVNLAQSGSGQSSVGLYVSGDGADTITGSADDEIIYGGQGVDHIFGGDGKDLIAGGDGNDVLSGGGGADFIVGGAGWDTLDLGLGGLTSGVNIAFSAIDSSAPDERPAFEFTIAGDASRAVDIENATLTSYSDRITVSYLGNAEAQNAMSTLKIDFGGSTTPSRTDDMLDFSNAGIANATSILGLGIGHADAGVYVDLSDRNDQIVKYYYDWGSVPGIGDIHTTGGMTRLQAANANSVKGTVFDDVLIAQHGSADHSEGYSALYGGGGNDVLTGGGWESHLYGGDGSGSDGNGADTFKVGANTFIDDGESGAGDRVYLGDFRLTGGVQQRWIDSGWAYSTPMNTLLNLFPAVASSLLLTGAALYDQTYMGSVRYRVLTDGTLEGQIGWGLGGSFYVKNYDLDLNSGNGTAGLTVWRAIAAPRDASLAQLMKTVNLALKSGFGVGYYGFDPLVLDLNGDGYNLVGESASSTYFEFDNDGFGEHTGWVRPTDGFLVRDINGNGLIDSVAEMFGNATTSGFAALSGFDSNSDGKVDASDTNFAALKIWQDADQDGITDAGELHTLGQLGIASISLATTSSAPGTAVAGNIIAREGLFTRTNGTTGKIADVSFTLNETNSKWLGDSTVSVAASALAQLNGYGELKNLRLAMTGDPALLNQVSAFSANSTTNLAALKAGTEAILYKWAGVEGVATTALGSSGIDTRKLAYLEKYSGYQLMPRDSNGVVELTNISQMEAMWSDQLTRLTLRLAVQGPLASTFAGISYDAQRDLLVASGPTALKDVLHNILGSLSSDMATAVTQWANWAPLLGVLADGMVRSDAAVVRGDYVVAQLVAAMDGVSQPLSLIQLATALDIPDLRIGTTAAETLSRGAAGETAIYISGGGNDVLNGGTGQDVYVFGRQVGQVVINDIENNESGDRIRFALHNRSEVTLQRSGDDLLVTVTGTGETVRVTGQFAAVTALGGGALLSTNKGIEDIQFADGTIMELPEIMTAVGTGTNGDDHLIGTMHSDVLIGGGGNDLLQGGDDGDIYVHNRGDGTDVINEVQTTVQLRAADMLIFGDNIAPDEVSFSRSGNGSDDLLISIANGGGSILVQGQFGYTSLGYTDPLAPNGRIETLVFREYGDNWSWQDVQDKLIAQATTSSSDTTLGFGGDDVFEASAGNDVLVGMDGEDTYRWDVGAGNDIIDEQSRFIGISVGGGGISLTDKADTIEFGPGIVASNIKFSRATAAPDLLVTNSATGETLTVKDQFNALQTGVLGAQWMDRIESFVFADGSRLSWQDVLARVTTGGNGNDELWGDLYADHMEGKGGDDILHGKGLGDTYAFNLGDGHDTLADDNGTFLGDGFITIDTTPDILQFGTGITTQNISFARPGNGADIDLLVGANGDRVTLSGQDAYFETGIFGALSFNRIEEVHFADGTVWDWQQLNARVLAASITSGNDTTIGFTFDDDIAASGGNDFLVGRDGADTYHFGLGSGHDIVQESVSNVLSSDDDRLVFASGITPSDVTISRNGADLTFSLASGDSITVQNQFAWSNWYTWNDVERFDFADGTSWTWIDVQQSLLQSTAGNDILTGFASDDVLDGGAGYDILAGGDGSDIYKFGLGYGADTIRETVTSANLSDFDTVQFGTGITLSNLQFSRTGNDLYVTVNGSSDQLKIEGQFNNVSWLAWNDIEKFEFADGSSLTNDDVAKIIIGGTPGDDHLIGTFGSDLLDGGAGNDLLEGGDGADRYIFGRGYGQDVIQEAVYNANLSDDDRLDFGPNISLSDLGFARSGNDLIITINGTSDSLRINGQFAWTAYFKWYDVESFHFAGGTSLTEWDVQNILISAQETSGNDTVTAFKSDDVLDGGAGDDILRGGDGADTYRFGIGSGHDRIEEEVTSANLSDYDVIEMGPGITANDVKVQHVGSDLVLLLLSSPSDSITVAGHFNGSGYYAFTDIEAVKFADGTIWDKNQIGILSVQGTNSEDTIIGTNGSDTIAGLKGNDFLAGGAGNDIYQYSFGDGADIVSDYVFYIDGGFDVLELKNLLPADVTVRGSTADSADMVLAFSDGGSVTIDNQNLLDIMWGIDRVRFDNGVEWTDTDLRYKYYASLATPGNDIIYGTNLDDRIMGGAGTNQFYESNGNDTYVWNLGDGDDLIKNGGSWDGYNVVEFGAGVAPDDVIVAKTANGQGIKLSINGQSGSVTLESQLVLGNSEGIDDIRFADGTVWNRATLQQKVVGSQSTSGDDNIVGTNGNDFLFGDAGNDTLDARDGDDILVGSTGNDTLKGGNGADLLTGGTGNDWVEGNQGDDVYRFDLGDGQDTIYDNSEGLWYGTWTIFEGGNDRLELGAGITTSNIQVIEQGTDDLLLTIAGTSDGILLKGVVSVTQRQIEAARFADGTTWNHSDLMNRALSPTTGNDTFYAGVLPMAFGGGAGNDTLVGSSGNDTLDGGADNDLLQSGAGNDILIGGTGNDRLEGSTGDDVYRFNLGDGQDTIYDNSEGLWYGTWTIFEGGNDRLELGAGITTSNIQVIKQGANDLVLKVTGTTDQILLQGVVSVTQRQIETVRFADGTTWTHADLMARAQTPPPAIAADAVVAGSMTELATTTGSTTAASVAGALRFTDGNASATHSLAINSLTPSGVVSGLPSNATLLSFLSFGAVTEPNGAAEGVSTWTFSAQDKTFDYLAAGQTAQLVYAVTLSNNSTQSVSQNITVTITGTNDLPIIAAGTSATGSITELAATAGSSTNDTASGTLMFTDGDTPDTHSGSILSVTAGGTTSGLPANATLLGWLSKGALVEQVGATAGSLPWSFAAPDSAFDYLGAGQTASLTYIVRTADSQGATLDQSVVVTITGSNDAPTAQAKSSFTTDNWTALTILGSTLTAGATDADTSDVQTLSSVQSPVGGTVALNAGNAVFTPTAVGPASFTYTLSDGHGGTSTASVSITTSLHQINGTSGNDTLSGGTKTAQINGGVGNDTITAGSAGDILVGGAGTDTLTGGAGIDTVDYSANSVAQTINLSLTTSQTISSGDADTISNVENAIGGSGTDTITGSSGNNVLTGNVGNDMLNGGAGNDTLLGGDGDDTLTGAAGNDTIDGGNGIDTVSYSANSVAQTINLTLATAQTISSGDVDTITNVENVTGGTAADTITGSTSNNILNGGTGNDTLNGNDGDDTLIGAAGNDIMNGGNGIDTVDYSANTVTQTINLTLTTQQTISSGNLDTLSNIENVLGGTGADTITGSTLSNRLSGGAGNDNISGNDGDDILVAGAGTDTLNGGNGIDTVDYSAYTANVTVNLTTTTAQTVATSDSDTITNMENVMGGSGADTLTGSTANNVINGGLGDDRLTGGAGDDTIIGGIGTNDIAVFAGLQASYTIATNAGVVTVTDNQPSADGNDGVDTVSGIEKVEFKGGVQVAISSPIVLDLNGDGVSLIAREQSTTRFDWDGDGVANKTGWMGSTDGLLVYDRNHDNQVSNSHELSFVDDKPDAKSDLDGLSAFDTNHDGLFSDADDAFGDFRVWRDANSNGRSDAGELMDLADAGVASITLAGEAVNKTWGWADNITINTGSFTRENGSTGAFSDVVFNYEDGRSVSRGERFGEIGRAAGQLAEAIASFTGNGGCDIVKIQDIEERKELVVSSAGYHSWYHGAA